MSASEASSQPVRHDPYPGLRNGLMYAAYDLLWAGVTLLLAPWWVFHCLFSASFRRMVWQRLTGDLPRLAPASAQRPRVLVHGVSVGEVLASRALVHSLREHCDVVISASTNTGMEVARREFSDLTVVRFPLDPSPVIRRFLRRVQPQHVILMELEVWPNFLKWSNRLGAPVAIVNGRITERSLRNYLRFHRSLPQFLRISLFAAQNEDYARRFEQLLGDDRPVVITGNIKADGLQMGALPRDAALQELEGWFAGRPDQPVLLAGSTHGDEEIMVYEAFHKACPTARIVLVPRHPPRAQEVVEGLAERGHRAQRLTQLRSGEVTLDPTAALIADTVGEMRRLYELSTIVFVGGSLVAHGGQNMLEPAARAKPVLYGPHTDNFVQETALLEQAGGALRVSDPEELSREVRRLVEDPLACQRMAEAAIEVVRAQRGATARTLRALGDHLGIPGGAGSA